MAGIRSYRRSMNHMCQASLKQATKVKVTKIHFDRSQCGIWWTILLFITIWNQLWLTHFHGQARGKWIPSVEHAMYALGIDTSPIDEMIGSIRDCCVRAPCVGPTIFRAGHRTQTSPDLPLPRKEHRRFEGEPGSLRDGFFPPTAEPPHVYTTYAPA